MDLEYKSKEELEKLTAELQQKINLIQQNAQNEYNLRIAKEQELENSKKQIELERKKNELLTQHLNKHKIIHKDELIYILTNSEDIKQNIFKVGKTTKKGVKSRLSSYNTGKSSECFYVYIKETVNAQYIENILGYLLSDFKFKISFEDSNIREKHEMYKIHFDDLVGILDRLIDAPNKTAEFLNCNHELLFKNSFSLESKVEKITAWKTNVNINILKDKKPKVKNINIPVVKTPPQISEETETNIKSWFENNIIKTENPKDFISMKTIIEKYKNDNPHIFKKDITQIIINILKTMKINIKKQHKITIKSTRKLYRNVILKYKFI